MVDWLFDGPHDLAEPEAVYRSRRRRQVSFCSRRAALLLVGCVAVGLIRSARRTPMSGLVMGTFPPPICLPLLAKQRQERSLKVFPTSPGVTQNDPALQRARSAGRLRCESVNAAIAARRCPTTVYHQGYRPMTTLFVRPLYSVTKCCFMLHNQLAIAHGVHRRENHGTETSHGIESADAYPVTVARDRNSTLETLTAAVTASLAVDGAIRCVATTQ